MKSALMKSLQKLSKETLREIVEELMTKADEPHNAIMAERERCAVIAESLNETVWELDNTAAWEIREHHGNEIAGTIRSGNRRA